MVLKESFFDFFCELVFKLGWLFFINLFEKGLYLKEVLRNWGGVSSFIDKILRK